MCHVGSFPGGRKLKRSRPVLEVLCVENFIGIIDRTELVKLVQ